MLSDREEQELGLIEAGLRDDARLTASFRHGGRLPLHRRARIVRAAIALGLVLAVAGPILADAGLAFQGVLIAGTAYVWWRWKIRPTLAPRNPPAPRADRRWWGFPPGPRQ